LGTSGFLAILKIYFIQKTKVLFILAPKSSRLGTVKAPTIVQIYKQSES
jgi:hypothetical protein